MLAEYEKKLVNCPFNCYILKTFIHIAAACESVNASEHPSPVVIQSLQARLVSIQRRPDEVMKTLTPTCRQSGLCILFIDRPACYLISSDGNLVHGVVDGLQQLQHGVQSLLELTAVALLRAVFQQLLNTYTQIHTLSSPDFE